MIIKKKDGQSEIVDVEKSFSSDNTTRFDFSDLNKTLDNFLKNLRIEIIELTKEQLQMLQKQSYSKPAQNAELIGNPDSGDDDVDDLIQDEEQIEKIILDNTENGVDFYPSEIAFKFNLDLETTMNVIHKMVERGVLDG